MEFVDFAHLIEVLNPEKHKPGSLAKANQVFKTAYKASLHRHFGGETFELKDKVIYSKLVKALCT